MAYTFTVNNTPLTGAIAFYQLVAALMAVGWLKKMDSDGTIYSATGTQVTHGGTGVGGLGNTRSWVRLQAPQVNHGSVVNQTREITIQRTTSDTQWRVKYSASALFTGGAPAILVTPSAADEVFMVGGGTDASPTFSTFFGTNAGYVWHIVCGGAAEFYSFVGWISNFGQSGATTNQVFALDAMQAGSHPATDVDPAVVYLASGSAFTDMAASAYPTANVTNPALARAWFGATSAAGALTTGTNNQNVRMSSYGTSVGTNTFSACLNPWNNKDDLLPGLWGNKASSGPKGIKGFSTLFMLPSVQRGNGETLDVASPGAKDKIFYNGIWLPWSGALPIL
jgi:hypothetical protein